MRKVPFLLMGLIFHSCYSTHSIVKSPRKSDISREGNVPLPHIEKIVYKVTYDSLDYRVAYGIKHDPQMLSRGHLFDTMHQTIRNAMMGLLTKKDLTESIVVEKDIPFFNYFQIYGREARIPKGSHEFHRSPWFDYHKPIDSVQLSHDYTHLSNTLIAEFKLLKMYRSGRGSAPTFSANIQLRFSYIGNHKVAAYRNFLIITTKSIGSGDYRRRGNENIDWWLPRHIDELVKRMQYELGLTDKKGRPL